MSDTAETPANGAEEEPKHLEEQPADEKSDEDELEITLGVRRDAASEGEEDEEAAAADGEESGDGFVTGGL